MEMYFGLSQRAAHDMKCGMIWHDAGLEMMDALRYNRWRETRKRIERIGGKMDFQ
jgi:hypothetical protein